MQVFNAVKKFSFIQVENGEEKCTGIDKQKDWIKSNKKQ